MDIILHPKDNFLVPSFIESNVPLRDKNWFKTGGNARYFCQPSTSEQFQEAVHFARDNQLPIFILGEGANILVSDDGFDGLVIQPQLKAITPKSYSASHTLVEAAAGVSFQTLIDWCLDNHITGLEEFSGIPGSVGGSVYINIHYFEFLLSHFLVSATLIHKSMGTIISVTADWFNFGYNKSTLQNQEYYLLTATFKLKNATNLEAAYAKGRRDEIIRHRKQRYPNSHTCGSFFRNFLDHEVTLMSAGKKLIYVAYYLDKIGVKGQLSVGDAIVSYQHANMLVNRGNATTQDIIQLARTMQNLVKEQFGIIPQTECILVGFKENPLLQK
jgi:UDP-N-acetylmuramate dehydrogenase